MDILLAYLYLGSFVALMATGFVVGRLLERRHYASIRRRERELQHVLAFTMRFPPNPVQTQHAVLVSGTVVISSDYFRTWVAGLRELVGGRFRSYESLVDRARREALLRLKEAARKRGSTLVVCVRFESTTITQGWAPSIEVVVYGTALVTRAAP